MTSRERVLTALAHKAPDRVPLDLGAGKACNMHMLFYKNLLQYLGIDEEPRIFAKSGQLAVASDAVLERLECDVRTACPALLKTASTGTEDWEDGEYLFFRDIWGVVLRMPKDKRLYYDLHEFPLSADDEEADASYAWPSPPAIDPKAVELARRYQAAGYPVIFTEHFGNGFLHNGPRLFGFDDWLAMLALDEDRVRRTLDKLLELKTRHFDNVLDAFGDAIDVIAECDDFGTQNALFVSPDMFRNLFKPYWRELFAHLKKRTDAKILLHSCGAVEPLLGDLIEVGVDIINPVQIGAAGMDPVGLKAKYGSELSFWGGGIDTQHMLPHGTPEQIRDHVKRNVEALSKDGGFVFATIHNVQADVPVENFIAMWEAFRECR